MSKTSDNVNLDFPARMADGRTFTDYRPNCVMNKILSIFAIPSTILAKCL